MILNNCPPLISICRLSHPSLRIGTILKIGYRRKTKNPSDRKLNPIEQTSRGPSGKRLHNYGKIHHFLMSKSTINGPFSLAMLNYQRVNDFWIFFGVAESPIPPKKIELNRNRFPMRIEYHFSRYHFFLGMASKHDLKAAIMGK